MTKELHGRDFDEVIADKHLMLVSAELEVALADRRDASLIKIMIAKSRAGAAVALSGLIFADPTEPKTIMQLQNEVRLFYNMVAFVSEIISDGKNADLRLSEEDHEMFAEVVEATGGTSEAGSQSNGEDT